MQNYNYNNAFLYPKEPSSASEMALMRQQRNPIIETDKNIERLCIQLNNIQVSSEKQYGISLIISVLTGIFAAGSFILTLIQFFK